jgi:prevent-host-death family protein
MATTISASDAQRRFGEVVDHALREPVMIQRHGRDVVAIMSSEEFKRLKRLERGAFYAHEIDEKTAKLIEDGEYGA